MAPFVTTHRLRDCQRAIEACDANTANGWNANPMRGGRSRPPNNNANESELRRTTTYRRSVVPITQESDVPCCPHSREPPLTGYQPAAAVRSIGFCQLSE